MAEVSPNASAYGQFFEAFEEANLPLSEANQPPALNDSERSALQEYLQSYEQFLRSGLLGKFIRAFEAVNHPLVDAGDSQMSLASLNSFNSMASELSDANNHSPFTFSNFVRATQAVSLNDNLSTNSLASLATQEENQSGTGFAIPIPTAVKIMIEMFDEFMHNHSYTA